MILLAVSVETGKANKALWTVVTDYGLVDYFPSLLALVSLVQGVHGLDHGEEVGKFSDFLDICPPSFSSTII